MRALHLLKTSVGATWALRQMRELVKLGVEVHVALPPGPLTPAYEAAGVSVHPLHISLPVNRPWAWPALFGRVRDLVDDVKPSIIHSHFVGTTLTMRLALGRSHPTPRVFQVPGPLHLEHAFFRQAELMTAGPQDYWMGSCRWTCDRYALSGIALDRISLAYYGVDLEHFVAGPRGTLRKMIGADERIKVIGMVAYMYAPKRYLGQTRGLKGHEDFIDAAKICLSEDANLVCVFIGGAWNGAAAYESRVRAYARKQLGERAIFLGTVNQVSELYPDFDVVVHPSHSENVGGAAESLLLGVPTITTDVGGFPDLVTSGETGWLVPAKSPDQLARAILAALADPAGARKMAATGQERARKLFDVRESARDVRDIYLDIVSPLGAAVRVGRPQAERASSL